DEAFTPDYLAQRMCGNRPIKNVLMDAGCVVGVGNIYANEALYLAGLRPDRPAMSIDTNETAQIVAAIRTVLALAIERGGTTLKDFRNTQGEPGFFQLDLRVYGRQGEACFACGAAIEKRRIGGRSSYFCPVCQR
ncbi:DNA-formamidopyrimidine glycosylase, partial [candidate division KSB1 bacterium]|nr:DNA-formamidopyrimidine glycosylase [candidate division KSB1 bacterium]